MKNKKHWIPLDKYMRSKKFLFKINKTPGRLTQLYSLSLSLLRLIRGMEKCFHICTRVILRGTLYFTDCTWQYNNIGTWNFSEWIEGRSCLHPAPAVAVSFSYSGARAHIRRFLFHARKNTGNFAAGEFFQAIVGIGFLVRIRVCCVIQRNKQEAFGWFEINSPVEEGEFFVFFFLWCVSGSW